MEKEIKETTLKEAPKRKNRTRLLILLAIVLIGGFFGIRAWIHSQHHVTTDNAQLDATITSVRSAVSGFVVQVRFEDNQHVKKGDTLVIIDNKDYLAKVMQAQSMLKSAEAQTGVSRVTAQAAQQNASASSLGASALQANINAAKARLNKAEKERDRVQKMFNEGAATQQTLDAVIAEYQTAFAQYDLANKQYQASLSQSGGVQINAQAQKEQVGVSNALVQQRVAELQLAQSQLANTVIVAPFDGIVSKKSVEIGQLLQIGQPVCSAVEIGNLWVTANFKETQLSRLKVGQKATISLDAYPSLHLTGTVESIGAATGAKFSLLPPDNATGNYVKITQRVPIRIKLDNTNKSQYPLNPGLSAEVDVEIE
jgi:membrane fusion protein (multidrug efflux system)